MKKFTEFLEKNCQWLAIGAGVLFLVWMIYSNVLTKPAYTVDVGGQPMLPGQVDEWIDQEIASPLKIELDDKTKVSYTVPPLDVVGGKVKLREYSLSWANSVLQDVKIVQPTDLPPPPGRDQPPGPPPVAGGQVKELPKPPAVTAVIATPGRGNVTIPAPVPVAVPGAMFDPNAVAPPPPPAPVLGFNGQPIVNGTDIGWNTVEFQIPLIELAKEFQRCNIPNVVQQNTTSFLLVELVRQEKLSDGQWGKEEICPKLTTSMQPPYPPDKAGKPAYQGYLNWAIGATVEILQPTFYQVLVGDQWTLSKDLVGAAALAGDPNAGGRAIFDPTQYLDMDAKQLAAIVPPLTQQERVAINRARDARKKQLELERRQSAPTRTTPPPRGGRAREGDYAPEDMYRPPQRYNTEYEGGMGAGAMQPSNYAGMFPLPVGEFDPRQIAAAPAAPVPGGPPAGNIVGWAIDAKPEFGKTYRYKIRYKIKNPVWSTFKVTSPQTLADEFALTSPDSEWTAPVKVQNVLSFYFATASQKSGQIDVYRWKAGVQTKYKFTVTAGDMIGSVQKHTTGGDVDYTTGYTLVDLRSDGRSDRIVAWLLTPEGTVTTRPVKDDIENKEKQELEKQIAAAAANVAAGLGGAGVTP